MKLISFKDAAGVSVGSVVNDGREVVNLSAALPNDSCFGSMQALIDGGPAAWDLARETSERARRRNEGLLPLAGLALLAPVPRPLQMRDFGCFSEHFLNCAEVKLRRRVAGEPDPQRAYEALVARVGKPALPADFLTRPRFYTCNRLSVVGHDAAVPWPRISQRLDFELEFGVFIGLPARDVALADARRHIFGYTLFNDLTMRDVQAAEERSGGKNKDFDCGNAMGPWIVTADEIDDPYLLRAVARVNGEVWGENNTRTMDRSFEQVIAYMSQSQTLHPGEFLASGTVGRCCGFEHDRYLKPGDVVELELQSIGVLRTRIVESGDLS